MSFHKDLSTGDIHVLNDQTYADTTARDADTDWNGDAENIGKVVRVDVGPTFYILEAITPTWLEITTSASQSLAGSLLVGNVTGGTDIIVETGDMITITDAPVLGTDGANMAFVLSQISHEAASFIFGAARITVAPTTTYLWPGFSAQAATTSQKQFAAYRSGELTGFSVKHTVALGNGSSITYTVQVNAIDTAITVTVASNSTTAVFDISNTATISQGDLISIKATKVSGIGTSPTDIFASLGFE